MGNAWLDNLRKSTFYLAQKKHGLYLHFKLDSYSYPKYNGRTNFTMEKYCGMESSFPLQLSGLKAFVGVVDVERYMIINAIVGVFEIKELKSQTSMSFYNVWEPILSSKENFNEYCEILFHKHSGHSVSNVSSDDRPDLDRDGLRILLLDCSSRYHSDHDRMVRMESVALTIWLLSKDPSLTDQLNILDELLVGKVKRVKEFFDWWCLT